MNDERVFKLKTVVFSALLSFVISGIGGAVLHRQLTRAKPLLVVSAAGFEGGSGLIQLEDAVVELTRDDSWGESFSEFESFETLRVREIEAGRTESRLVTAIKLTEEWLDDHGSGERQLSENELLSYPDLNHRVFGGSVHGMIRRRDFIELPVKDFETYPRIFPLFYQPMTGDPLVHTGKKGVNYPTAGFYGSDMEKKNKQFADSVSRGIRGNLVAIAEHFLEEEREALIIVRDLRKALQETILFNSRPSISLTIHNAGGTTIAFRPYFGMAVLGAEGEEVEETYLMVQADTTADSGEEEWDISSGGGLADLFAMAKQDEGKDVQIDPYLPKVGGMRYLTIEPGGTKTVKLVATQSLGESGPQYESAFRSGLLRIKVVGLSLSSKPFWSSAHKFGANVNQDDASSIREVAMAN